MNGARLGTGYGLSLWIELEYKYLWKQLVLKYKQEDLVLNLF